MDKSHADGPQPDQPKGLMRLPPELRVKIYELVLPRSTTRYFDEDDYATQPELTRVCRQIRNESLLLFYNNNSFGAWFRYDRDEPDAEYPDTMQAATEWIQCTPVTCHQAVKRLELSIRFQEKMKIKDWRRWWINRKHEWMQTCCAPTNHGRRHSPET